MAKKQNELSTIESKYPVLNEGSDMAAAIAANVASGDTIEIDDLTMIKVPSQGLTTWVWQDVDGEQTSPTIEGVLVLVQRRSALWPTTYGEGDEGPSLPFLVSFDMLTGHRVGDDTGDLDVDVLDRCKNDDGTYRWQDLPYTKFGSGRDGHGKRTNDEMMLFVLRENTPWPVYVSCPAMSIKPVSSFVKNLPVPHYRAIVSLSLMKEQNRAGQPYSRIVPSMTGELGAEAGEAILKLYTEPMRAGVTRW